MKSTNQESSFLGSVLAQPTGSVNGLTFRDTQTQAKVRKLNSLHPARTVRPTLNLFLDEPTAERTLLRAGNKILSFSAPALLNSSVTFEDACSDPNFTLNPGHIGFIPHSAWQNEQIPFGTLVVNFFRKRNSMHCKFPFKLYNALLLTDKIPSFYRFVGIRWVTDAVFVVDKNIFAKLLGVRTIDGSLFHQQGNFPSHGFVELSFQEASQIAEDNGMGVVDSSSMRFLKHAAGRFTHNCPEFNIDNIKWMRG